MYTSQATGLFLSLVRLGIGHSADELHEQLDWHAIKALADQHGLSAVIIDGLEHLPNEQRPPKTILLEWIASVVQVYEYRYEQYRKAIADLAAFYNGHGYKMMLLKGYACSLDWPKPDHRPCGDIDVWLFGQQREADIALGSWFKIQGLKSKIDTRHHHHTVFEWKGFSVENHYDFVNVHAHRSGRRLEKIFKQLGMDESCYVYLDGKKIYIPTPNLHALFLIRHMASHFAAAEITVRQVLDWAFFVEKHGKDVDWDWLVDLLDKFHMKEFFNLANAICVEDLGFSVDLFPSVQFVPSLKESVLNDILQPEFTAVEPHGLVRRMIYKYRRWQGNAWKQELCYNESRREMFWTGIRAKIMKPASF